MCFHPIKVNVKCVVWLQLMILSQFCDDFDDF